MSGVRLNFSKKGMGVRVGGKHGGVSVGPGGSRVSASIPGTGIYYTKKIGSKKGKSKSKNIDAQSYSRNAKKRPIGLRPWYIALSILIFFSGLAAFTTSFAAAVLTILVALAMLLKTGYDYNKGSNEE